MVNNKKEMDSDQQFHLNSLCVNYYQSRLISQFRGHDWVRKSIVTCISSSLDKCTIPIGHVNLNSINYQPICN